MSEFFDISAALDARTATIPGTPPVALPNSKFEPVKGTLYLRVDMLPADTEGSSIGIGSGGTDDYVGIYLVNIFAPVDDPDGKFAAYTMADTVADHYKEGTLLTYNGRVVRCESTSLAPAIRSDDRWQVPVRIRYYSHLQKR